MLQENVLAGPYNRRYGAVVEKLNISGMNKAVSPVSDPGHHDRPQTIARCVESKGFPIALQGPTSTTEGG
jgi:hypothetical protein